MGRLGWDVRSVRQTRALTIDSGDQGAGIIWGWANRLLTEPLELGSWRS